MRSTNREKIIDEGSRNYKKLRDIVTNLSIMFHIVDMWWSNGAQLLSTGHSLRI